MSEATENPEVENENDELEIEVVDDVPEDQKPRRAEDAKPNVPEDDEIENYSESVQKRIKQLKFEFHEAERQKAAAAREREEAVKYAQQVLEQNRKLQEQLQKGQSAVVEQAKGRLEVEVASARAAYKAAYEAGDADALADAQEKLIDLRGRMMQLQTYRPPQPERVADVRTPQPQPQQPQVQLSPRQRDWLSKNDWYGKDGRMTGFALGVHEELMQRGVDPDSEKYYSEVDAAMRQHFADRFSDGESEVSAPVKKAAPVVAPAARNAKTPRKVQLTATQDALRKRLGLTREQYVAQLLKEARNG